MHIIEAARAGVITEAPSVSSVGMNVLNFLLSVVGIIAIISLVLAGIMYVTAQGDEKRMRVAKKSAQYTILGIILAMGAMVVIAFVGKFFTAQ